jgi:protein TonB
MNHRKTRSTLRSTLTRLLAVLGAVALTLAFFLLLPVMQRIQEAMDDDDMIVRTVETAEIEPPPEIEEEEEPPPEEEPKEQPKLDTQPQPASLAELDLALGGGTGIGPGAGQLKIDVAGMQTAAGSSGAELFSMADLDQKPRPVFQPSPNLSPKLRRRTPGTVYVIFIVDETGRVVQPRVQRSTDPIFERPALNAIKRWRFEPGKRGGEAVRFRMRVPITFPKSR